MKTKLILGIKVHRTHFLQEHFTGTDDIFALVERGTFTCTVDGKTETVTQGDGYCFKAGIRYDRHVVDEVSLFLFRYQGDEFCFPSGKITFRDTAHVQSAIALLNAVNNSPKFDEYDSKQALFYGLLVQYRAEHSETLAAAEPDKTVTWAKQYFAENLRNRIRLDDVAAACHLSYIQFYRRFKAETLVSPGEYVLALRMKRASQLLESTNLTVKTIAEECGFYDEYYFSNSFKKYYHLPPTEFRRNTR